MKISVVISAMLIAQVSASFFDMFQGAVLSVQNSVGKLISDVAIDVRDTVDCTILAVEHVLSLSDDATARYNDKCGGGKNKTDSEKNGHQDVGMPKVEVSLEISNNDEYFRKEIPAEIDARINETLKKVLGSYNPHENILSVQNVLAKESKQLTDVSSLVKQELEKLTNEVNSDFKNVKQKESEPSVDTILQEIRLLENRERRTKNNSEANEIHKVIDEVLDKLDVIEATEATENLKLEEILKALENNSDSSFVSLKQQFGEWKKEESRNLDEIKNKMEEHERNAKNSKYFHNRKSNNTEPVDLIMNKTHNVNMKPSKIDGILLLNNETAQQASKNNSSNDIPFIEIPNSTQLSSSLLHITSTNNEKDRSEHFLNTPGMEMVVSPTTSTMAYENERSTILTSIAPILLNDNVLSDVVISPSSITDNRSENVIISILANKNEESSTLPTNEHDSNKKVITSIPLLITETTSNSEIYRIIESTTDSEENKLPVLTRNKPIASPNTVNESITKIPFENEEQLALTTQTSLNDGKLSDTVIASTTFTVVENTPLSMTDNPVELATFSGNEESSTSTAKMLTSVDFNDTANISSQIVVSATVSETIQSIESTTVFGYEQPSVSTSNPNTNFPNIANDDDSNNTTVTSTSSPIKVSIAISETTKPIETAAVSGNETPSILTTTNLNISNDDLNETLITSTSSPFKVGITISDTTQPVETTTASGIEELLTIFTNKLPTTLNISNEDESNDTMITSTSSPIKVIIAETETTQSIETTNDSGNVDLLTLIINTTTIASVDIPNDTTTMSTSYPIKSSDMKTRTTQPIETTNISGNEEPPTLTKYKFTITPNIAIDNDSNDTMVMNTPTPITINMAVIETTQPIEIATVSRNEENSTMSINKPTTSPITSNDDSSNEIETTNASTSIVENATDNKIDKQEPVTIRAENVESSNSDTNGSFIIGTSFPTTKSTLVSEVIQPTESTMTTKNEFASVINKINGNYLNITVTSTTFPITGSTLVIKSDQQIETTKASQNQESSTLNSIQSTINPESPHDTLVAETLSTTTDKILVKNNNPSETPSSLEKEENLMLNTEQTIASTNVLNYSLGTIVSNVVTESSHDRENLALVNSPTTSSGRDLTTLVTAQVTTTPKIINYQDLKSPRFIITESPIVNENIPVFNKPIIPENRKWLTPSRRKNTSNIFNQQYYNTNAAPINENYSITDRISKTGTPLITKGVSDESQTIPINGKSAIPLNLYNQQPSSSNQEQLKYPDVRESIEYIRKRILETGTPYTISRYISTTPVNMDTISTAAPTFPAIRDIYTPRRPLYPENPNYMQTPRNLIHPRYPYNRPLANTNRIPMGLTTHNPITTASRTGNNYRNAPLDYDSFFHIPQTNSEAHQRALREARQLIENSKRSEQIINNILKNKKNIGRRSIFNNPRTLNAGK